jgi:hypothetical protein
LQFVSALQLTHEDPAHTGHAVAPLSWSYKLVSTTPAVLTSHLELYRAGTFDLNQAQGLVVLSSAMTFWQSLQTWTPPQLFPLQNPTGTLEYAKLGEASRHFPFWLPGRTYQEHPVVFCALLHAAQSVYVSQIGHDVTAVKVPMPLGAVPVAEHFPPSALMLLLYQEHVV